MSYIEIKNVSKSFDGKPVLKDISLSIDEGEFITFLGSSGCGKTTLLRSLIGLENLDSGHIYMSGQDVTSWSANQREMIMIFQQYCLFPTMNVYNNVSFPLRMQKIDKGEIQKRVQKVLELVDMRGHEKKYPFQLSGGEQQRISLARGLITNPKVLLLDEPFSAIDAKLRRELQVRVKEIHKELGMTSIFVTHDQEEAMVMSDRIYLFKDGEIEQSGTARELYLTPQTDYVASFIGNYNRFSREEFAQIFEKKIDAERIAIRPEVISIKASKNDDNAEFCFMGTIIDIIPRGNVLRYVVEKNDHKILVDELFDETSQWSIQEKVLVNVAKKNLILF